MTKQEFLENIRKEMKGLPECEVEERTAFYSEMIDDRVEDGMSEEEAVASLGNINEIIDNIKGELQLNTIVKNKIESQKKKSFGQLQHRSCL